MTLLPGQYGAVTVFSRGPAAAFPRKLRVHLARRRASGPDPHPLGLRRDRTPLRPRHGDLTRGSTLSAGAPRAPRPLADLGTAPLTLTIESPFLGTIVAPNASLTLQSLNGSGVYTGEFFANRDPPSPLTPRSSPTPSPASRDRSDQPLHMQNGGTLHDKTIAHRRGRALGARLVGGASRRRAAK